MNTQPNILMKTQPLSTHEQLLRLLIAFHIERLRCLDKQLQRLKKRPAILHRMTNPKPWPRYRWENSNN